MEQLTAGMAELFPTTKLYGQDLTDLLAEPGTTAGKVVQVLRWLKKTSNTDWAARLAKGDSAFLLMNFDRMQALRDKWFASVKENRNGTQRKPTISVRPTAEPVTCSRCEGKGTTFSKILGADMPCSCPAGSA